MEYRKVFCGVIRACLVVGRMGMNRIRLWGFLLGAALVQVMPMYGAMPDKTLLRIGGREVSSAEFESYYRQYADSATETPQRYLQRFVLFKLKVADARRQGWDTLPDFRQACRVLQAQVLKRTLVDPDKKKAFLRECYQRESARVQLRQWIRMEGVSILLPQCASGKWLRQAEDRMEELSRYVRQGMTLEEAVRRFPSEDDMKLVMDTDTLWRPAAGLLQEFSTRLLKMRPDEYSEPFVSPLGVHLVRLLERKQEVGFTQAMPWLENYVDRLGVVSGLLNLEAYAAWNEQNKEALPEGLRMELQQVADGLLVACWDKQNHIGEYVSVSPVELKHYFDQNRAEYAWSLPHYKGAVIHCQDKKVAKKLRKMLKKLSPEMWVNAIRKWTEEHPDSPARIQQGLFQIGKNPYVDKLAFKCGSYQPMEGFPYVFVMGKCLKKGPEAYTDVRRAVTEDYRLAQEKDRLGDLRKRFAVEINSEVLKTVNCSGSN